MTNYQKEQRTASLMRRLYGLWIGRDLDDSRHYQAGSLYSPHMLTSEGEDLPRQSLRGLADRGWVQMVKEPHEPGEPPQGLISLTDEGREVVLAMRAAEGD